MGGTSSSPRSVTLQQDDESGVVKVSESVARRLVGKPDPVESSKKQSSVDFTRNDEEVEKIQSQYEKRIEALEKQNKDLYQSTTEQFAAAVQEVEKKFLKTTASPICDDLQNQVMQCYQENQKETIHCSGFVKAYSNCVQQQRETILTKKEDCQPCILAQMARGPCGAYFMKAYDCYLEEKDMAECGKHYLDMKDCWDRNPDYGYHKMVDTVNGDEKPGMAAASPIKADSVAGNSNKLAEDSSRTAPSGKGKEQRIQS